MGKIKSFFNLKNIINVWAYPKWWAHPFLSCFIKKKKKNSGEHRARSFFSGELPSVSSSTIRPMYQTYLSSLYPRITMRSTDISSKQILLKQCEMRSTDFHQAVIWILPEYSVSTPRNPPQASTCGLLFLLRRRVLL